MENIIWEIIGGKNYCSFKTNIRDIFLCNNPLNVTSLCSRKYCPLSSNRYSTVIFSGGNFFLYVKCSEKNRFPSSSWKKFKLSRNYIKAVQQIDKELALYPKSMMHRTKQKLTKIYHFYMREKMFSIDNRKNPLKKYKDNIYSRTKENLSLKNIPFHRMIEHELLGRLHIGVYGEIYSPLPLLSNENNFERNRIKQMTEVNNLVLETIKN